MFARKANDSTYVFLILFSLCAWTGLSCSSSGSSETATDTTSSSDQGTSPTDAGSSISADAGATDSGVAIDTGPMAWNALDLEVGAKACCLTMANERVAWAEDGDLFLYDPKVGKTTQVVTEDSTQMTPFLHGDLLIFADDRGGDFDLYGLDLNTGVTEVLVAHEGDQDWPIADGDILVWVSRMFPPYSAKEADIWMLDLSDPNDNGMFVTDDFVEQSHPHVHSGKIVWDDYSADPDGVYTTSEDPNENNADIYGYDTALGQTFVVTDNPSKQLRPAIENHSVVWMDWRGVNPQPKYSSFEVYGMDLEDGVEHHLVTGSWLQPELWQRPAVHQGYVALIREVGTEEAPINEVAIAALTGTIDHSVAQVPGALQAVDFRDGAVGWIGPGVLGVTNVDDLLSPDGDDD